MRHQTFARIRSACAKAAYASQRSHRPCNLGFKVFVNFARAIVHFTSRIVHVSLWESDLSNKSREKIVVFKVARKVYSPNSNTRVIQSNHVYIWLFYTGVHELKEQMTLDHAQWFFIWLIIHFSGLGNPKKVDAREAKWIKIHSWQGKSLTDFLEVGGTEEDGEG